ncbi:riboflavin synthase [bacterium]|nr:riboflavin synthase [bacterium]
MFTGIVETVGQVAEIHDGIEFRKIRITGPDWIKSLNVGSSLAINGCCTTSIPDKSEGFTCELMRITLEKTSLGKLVLGSEVNLERPLKFGAELGGHLVQGHVDGLGKVVSIVEDGDNRVFEFQLPAELMKYVVHTGSIAVDGVSLTAAEVKQQSVVIGIIPHTYRNTVFHNYMVGDPVNIEVDMVGKYIEKLLPEKLRAL